MSQAWWYTLVIPAPGRLRQENGKVKASLAYIARPCLNTTKERHHFKDMDNRLSVVAQACNPNYLGGRDREYHSLREKFRRPPISNNGWVWWYTHVIPAMQRSINRRIRPSQA
jgi:hypothetical protein